MLPERAYVDRLLDRYRRLPGTLHRVLRDDRRTARELYRRRIDPLSLHQAFVLALARRHIGAPRFEIIRSLRYFLPILDEILDTPLDPAYIRYLEFRLRRAGVDVPL